MTSRPLRVVLALAACTAQLHAQLQAQLHSPSESSNPDSARIVSSDVPRFWQAFDARPALGAPRAFESLYDSLYLEPGTVGLRDFARMRIGTARDLASAVLDDSAFYRRIRGATVSVAAETAAVRVSLRRLHALYDAAVFPDVYLLIGRRRAAGTVSNAGVLIGLETLAAGDDGPSIALLPAVVAHEVVHYQQHIVGRTLLALALREGGADFVAELVSGRELNRPLHDWLRAHEAEVWAEFQGAARTAATQRWFDQPPRDGWPRDLAYAVGYRIAQAYYAQSPDKRAAIRETLVITEPDAYVTRSGYRSADSMRLVRLPRLSVGPIVRTDGFARARAS